MEPVKVTVVIPVFDSEEGISRCIESLRSQTLQSIEMIFVDDCGTDNSVDIIRKAAIVDARIRLLRNPYNMGAGASRNRGIEEARGKYMAFVDPDDYVSDDFLELLYKQAEKTHADIVKGICLNIDENGHPEASRNPYLLNKKISDGLKEGLPLYTLFTYQHTTAIYNREMLNSSSARYAPSNFSEDSAFLLKACYAAKRITFADTASYYYVSRGGSGVRNFSLNRWSGTVVSLKDMLGFIENNKIYNQDGYQYAITRTISLLDLQKYFEDNDKAADSKKMLTTVIELVKSLPYGIELAKMDGIIDALMRQNINLSVNPYGKDWRNIPYSEYENRVNIWVTFLQRFPEFEWNNQAYIWRVFENCITYGKWKSLKEKNSKLRELRKKAHLLPDKAVLTRNYISMRIFVDFGLDLFNMRKTKTGEAVRVLMALMRKSD